jgi:transposase
MALCSKLQVKLPAKGIIVCKSGKYPYVYHVDATYRNAKGVPTNKKRSIGKLDNTSGMLIPNQTYYEIYEAASETILQAPNVAASDLQRGNEGTERSYGEVRTIGFIAVIEAIFDNLGITEILKKVIGSVRSQMVMTVVAYMLTEGNVMQYIDDFCENSLYRNGLTDRDVSRLFSSLENAERMSFFKEWIGLHIQNEYIAYDVTSFSTYSRNIDDAEYGYNRDGESLPQINLALYMGQTSLLPMFYVTYNGSIVDKSHLKYMMGYNAELGIENVSFVMDKGFATTDNAEFMHANGYQFILGAGFNTKAIQQSFTRHKPAVQSAENYILSEKIYGLAVKGRYYGIAATLHIFYDPAAVPKQTADFFRKIAVEENELAQLKKLDAAQTRKYSRYFVITKTRDGFSFERDNAKINETRERLGYFFMLTNKELTPEKVVSIYRKRDVIEKGFDEIKNGLDMNRLRTHSSDTTDGKMFCAFLSLICRLHMQNKLRELMDEHNLSNERIVRELSKIKAIDLGNKKRLLNPITKIQKDILHHLGLKPDIFSTYLNALNL